MKTKEHSIFTTITKDLDPKEYKQVLAELKVTEKVLFEFFKALNDLAHDNDPDGIKTINAGLKKLVDKIED